MSRGSLQRFATALREGRLTFGLREAIVISLTGVAIAVAAALASL